MFHEFCLQIKQMHKLERGPHCTEAIQAKLVMKMRKVSISVRGSWRHHFVLKVLQIAFAVGIIFMLLLPPTTQVVQ